MSRFQTIEDALHTYLDGLEDLQIDAAARLVRILSGVSDRAWLGLSRAETMTALSRRIGAELARYMIPRAEEIALDLATEIGRPPRAALSRLRADLKDPAAREAVGVLLTPRQVAAATLTVSEALSQPLQDAQAGIARLVAESDVRDRAGAARLIERVQREVVAPLRGEAGADTLRAATSAAAQTIGGTALSMASVRLRALPDATPEQLEQRQRDALHVWVCALTRTCHDCMPRHGQEDTMANWRQRGTPRSGWSVCKLHCKCLLLPRFGGEALDHASTVQPLRREAMRAVEEGTPRGLTVRLPPDVLEIEPSSLEAKRAREERLRERYRDDPRVRRAYRMLGQINASAGGTADVAD